MDKKLLKQCIEVEVYGDYSNNKLSILDKIWCRYFRPRSNAVYLIRKYQYYIQQSKSGTRLHRFCAKLLSRSCGVKLMRRYSISIHPDAEIGVGLRIIHPAGLFITHVTIGNNATFFQNCTIGVRQIDDDKEGKIATIGDNLVMYANSIIVGKVAIGNNVTIGANSCLFHDADDNCTCIGNPAIKK